MDIVFLNGTSLQVTFSVLTHAVYRVQTRVCPLLSSGLCASKSCAVCDNPTATLDGRVDVTIIADLAISESLQGEMTATPRRPVLVYAPVSADLGCQGHADSLFSTGYQAVFQTSILNNGIVAFQSQSLQVSST